jgi:hypothetical protein
VRIEARNKRDILAGLAFLSIALAGLWIARGYTIGTPGQMGKGFMPIALCGLLAILGLATIIRGAASKSVENVKLDWRSLVPVVAGFAIFGLTLNTLGFVVASALMLAIGGLALPRQRLMEMILTAAVLIAACGVIFVVALGLPIPIWPRL